MAARRKKFSSQANPDILAAIQEIAKNEGRQFQAVLEEAMIDYIEKKNGDNARSTVMAHFRASVAANQKLGELLAK